MALYRGQEGLAVLGPVDLLEELVPRVQRAEDAVRLALPVGGAVRDVGKTVTVLAYHVVDDAIHPTQMVVI